MKLERHEKERIEFAREYVGMFGKESDRDFQLLVKLANRIDMLENRLQEYEDDNGWPIKENYRDSD